ncbi:MAG: hypothetical protein FGM46_05315 [Ferruginibacter sp.]|nr:hypothetical protein [Ferruginibacter sp.]
MQKSFHLSNPNDKLFLKNFQRFKKKAQRTTDTTMTQKINTDNSLQRLWTRTTGYNSTYPKYKGKENESQPHIFELNILTS